MFYDHNITAYVKLNETDPSSEIITPESSISFKLLNILDNKQYKVLYKKGDFFFEIHNSCGPALCDKEYQVYRWIQHGWMHRIDGPAQLVVDSISMNQYYVFGHYITEDILMNNQKYFKRLESYLKHTPEEWSGLADMFSSTKRLQKCINEDKICIKIGSKYRYYRLGDRLDLIDKQNETQIAREFDFRIDGTSDSNIMFIDAGHTTIDIGTNSPTNKLNISSNTTISKPGTDPEVTWGAALGIVALFGMIKAAQKIHSKKETRVVAEQTRNIILENAIA